METRTAGRWLVKASAVGILLGAVALAQEGGKVRPAYCAGGWYPGDAAALGKLVDDLLAKSAPGDATSQPSAKPLALICPHAGYRFSAPVAAAAYAQLRGRSYKRVIVLAFSHRNAGSYRGIDVPRDLTAYATPLGEVSIDRTACDVLLKNSLFTSHPNVDGGEHALELQLPLLQRALKEFALVPLLIGQMSERDYTAAAQAILPLLGDDTLLVASSDFTHFGPDYGYQPFKENVPDKLRELAEQSAATLVRCDYDGFVGHVAKTQDTICGGHGPIPLLLRVLAMGGGAQGSRAARRSGNSRRLPA